MSDNTSSAWFPGLVIDPKLLGSDLRLSLLKRQGPPPFSVTPPRCNVTYRFMALEPSDYEKMYNASVLVTFGCKDLEQAVDARTFGEQWAADATNEQRLDRRVYAYNKAQRAHREDLEHVGGNLTCAALNRPEYLTEAGIDTLTKKFTDMYTGMYGFDALSDKPLAVCVGCNFHSDKPMKRCPCSSAVVYCSRRCQRAHWNAGHRAEHSISGAAARAADGE